MLDLYVLARYYTTSYRRPVLASLGDWNRADPKLARLCRFLKYQSRVSQKTLWLFGASRSASVTYTYSVT